MKKFLFLPLFLFYFFSNAQTEPYEVPNVFPASPEASTLGAFGEIPINMATGTTGFSIPLYTINEGGFSLPVTLDYYNNGLIVNNIPGNLGLGWSLNAGGMVTRQVRGRPDEDTHGYIGTQMIGLNWVKPYFDGQLNTSQIYDLNDNASDGTWDTQPDKFMVSVGNMSATFYFDQYKNVMIKPYKPYIIEVINDDFAQGFEITDDYGVVYTFQAIEESERIPPILLGEISATTIGGYISGWKLTQIMTPNNRIVSFNYSDYTYQQKITYQSHDIKYPNTPQTLRTIEANYEIRSKIITSIDFTSGQIVFNSTSQATTDFNEYFSRINSIDIKDIHNDVVNKYGLTYDDVNKTRKLLKKIEINQDPTNTYQFDYAGVPEDDIPFHKQDYWGYANSNIWGKLIKLDDLYEPRKPDFNQAIIGTLTRITHPTKGTTEFAYESNTYDPGVDGDEWDDYYDEQSGATCENSNQVISVFKNIYNASAGPFYLYDEEIFTITESTPASISAQVEKQSIWGLVEVKLEKIDGSSQTGCQDAWIGPCDPSNPCDTYTIWFSGGVGNGVFYDEFVKKVYLTAGTYRLTTKIGEENTPAYQYNPINHAFAVGSVALNVGNNSPPQARSREVGGVRIAQVKSCPDENPSNCVTKEYIYETDTDISQGRLFRRRNLYTSTYGTSAGGFTKYSSNSNVPLGSYMGSHILYKEVIERSLVNGNPSNGSKKTIYNFVEIPDPVSPFIDKDNKEYQNGKVLEEHFINDENFDDKTLIYQYDFSEFFAINPHFNVLSFKSKVDIYVEFGNNAFVNDTEIFSNHFDVDLLVRVRDFSNLETNILEVDKHYEYTSKGHVYQKDVTNSDGSVFNSLYRYPYDLLTGVYIDLKNANRFAVPAEIMKYKDGTLLSKQTTVYDNWSTGIIEPEYVQTAKALNLLEDRLRYHEYDNFGNILEASKQNGIRVSYIWGYNNSLPVAKLENVSYSQIPIATINSIHSLSDADDDFCGDGSSCDESALRTALNNLKNQFPDAIITTYTYNPLIGISSITDSKGYTMYYEYDNQNRLKFVLDQDRNVINVIEYNLKN